MKTIYLIRHVEGKKTAQGWTPNEKSFSQLLGLKEYFHDITLDNIYISQRRACDYTVRELFGKRARQVDDRLGSDALMKSYHRRRSQLGIYPLHAGTEQQLQALFETNAWPHADVLDEYIAGLPVGTHAVITHGGVLLSYLQQYRKTPYKEVMEQIPCGSVHRLRFS